jgi:SAM-dependent methyltransferase/uncharacterized protein YbaR (Trm112 family)
MNQSIPNALLVLLACPDCGGDLDACAGGLRCNGCTRLFEIRNGIPILYPENIDAAHIAEEEKLGEIMKQPSPGGKECFSENQWIESKEEFWEYVEHRLGAERPMTIAYIGSGIDTRFLELKQKGHTVVAFDLTFNLLYALREEHGSPFNVAGAVEALPFKKGSFDALCCIDLIHHEHDAVPRILGSFETILKPGGYLFLEDINAWGLYQFSKSILMPKPLHRALRSMYHRLRRSHERPADYEFPTSVWKTRNVLERLGFQDITVVPQRAYPNVRPAGYKLYTILARSKHIRKYHNFHYMIAARKS